MEGLTSCVRGPDSYRWQYTIAGMAMGIATQDPFEGSGQEAGPGLLPSEVPIER